MGILKADVSVCAKF